MTTHRLFTSRWLSTAFCALLCCGLLPALTAQAQTEVAGAFEGRVTDIRTKNPISGATVRIRNVRKGLLRTLMSDNDGRFYQGLLEPDLYEITVQKSPEYLPATIRQTIFTNQTNQAIPLPVGLTPATAAATATPTPAEPTSTQPPGVTPTPEQQASTPPLAVEDAAVDIAFNRTDGRRGGVFTEKEVSTLPLGSSTLTRTFDELALLLPGVAPPPLTLGTVAGPGVGPGVGSAGQFSVNGLRSRSNNFTVDGSDNNDEDIGVRRQGFFSLVPQPIESVQEYQVITLLAPAQFGRNFGGQVNAVSKSGGNEFHGTVFGFFNSSQLNSQSALDTNPVSGGTALTSEHGQPVLLNNRQLVVPTEGAGEDSFTLGQGGFVLGGPIKRDSISFFLTYERQILNATKESNFAVPTVDQRGAFNSGATGLLFQDFAGTPRFAFPTTLEGDAVFSLFPFPNNPTGIYGVNTLTQVLPASARGNVASGKVDWNFKFRERPQTFAARYNITQDYRDIPVTGGAIFSTLRPRVRTQNLSTFLNSELSAKVFNSLRLSYGRTRLKFQERRHPSQLASQASPGAPFLLNAPLRINNTLPNLNPLGPNTGPVFYGSVGTTEQGTSICPVEICGSNGFAGIGRVGQVQIAGFSPVGVDVFNFPQDRVDNTYQLADQITWRIGRH
ncbi:MAG TPA: carboxypeptidase-like regulatory domain-containing protein, partial [Pyrinomonadaceae bacterium]